MVDTIQQMRRCYNEGCKNHFYMNKSYSQFELQDGAFFCPQCFVNTIIHKTDRDEDYLTENTKMFIDRYPISIYKKELETLLMEAVKETL